jgi:hypothetical protein
MERAAWGGLVGHAGILADRMRELVILPTQAVSGTALSDNWTGHKKMGSGSL